MSRTKGKINQDAALLSVATTLSVTDYQTLQSLSSDLGLGKSTLLRQAWKQYLSNFQSQVSA